MVGIQTHGLDWKGLPCIPTAVLGSQREMNSWGTSGQDLYLFISPPLAPSSVPGNVW